MQQGFVCRPCTDVPSIDISVGVNGAAPLAIGFIPMNPMPEDSGKLSFTRSPSSTAMESEVTALGADLWISGHTHFDHDFVLGRTRLISHQRGYVGSEADESFQPRIVVLD